MSKAREAVCGYGDDSAACMPLGETAKDGRCARDGVDVRERKEKSGRRRMEKLGSDVRLIRFAGPGRIWLFLGLGLSRGCVYTVCTVLYSTVWAETRLNTLVLRTVQYIQYICVHLDSTVDRCPSFLIFHKARTADRSPTSFSGHATLPSYAPYCLVCTARE